jgi:arsenite methyltransferase
MSTPQQDQWAQWLLQRRHGGDPEKHKALLQTLAPIRDQVLEHARLQPGETLLDIGCGDGLIAFGALSQVGEQGRVIFSDISQDLLDHCQSLAQQMGVLEHCQFIRASANNLREALSDHAVEAVTTRSVLIYVPEKQLAFNEFYRVLKPGGRLSIFEPINRLSFPEPPNRFFGYDVTPITSLAQKLKLAFAGNQPSTYGPMMDFGEQDLVTYAEKAGFTEIHLTLNMDIVPGVYTDGSASQKPSWGTFLKSSPNPLAPTLEELLEHTLTPEEATQFTHYLRPLVETGQQLHRMALAYLWAVK